MHPILGHLSGDGLSLSVWSTSLGRRHRHQCFRNGLSTSRVLLGGATGGAGGQTGAADGSTTGAAVGVGAWSGDGAVMASRRSIRSSRAARLSSSPCAPGSNNLAQTNSSCSRGAVGPLSSVSPARNQLRTPRQRRQPDPIRL